MTATATTPVLNTRTDRELADGWTAEVVAGPAPENVWGVQIAATIPGSIHTDLMAAGLIVDPYLDDHERLVAWVGSCDWRYATSFEYASDGNDRTDLVFEGLDTIATVELNGERVADTINMHRTYRIDVGALLRDGANDLVVTFASPVKYADRASLEQGYRPHVNHHPYNSIRKMACSFGWDWGPDTATVGIWRPVTLSSWSTARIAAVRPTATVTRDGDRDRGSVALRVDLEQASESATTVTATVGGESVTAAVDAGAASVDLTVTLDSVERWWPRGYGDQPLYDLSVVLEGDDSVLDEWTGRVGFRTVRLDHDPDDHGTAFTFVINDVPVFIRGANWIPDDAFPHRVDRARYSARITQAESANINLLRVWGGGIYEDDAFYELCDERGILTWQDFLFACAAYSEDEPMRSEVEAEARDNITRLMPHPSLILWNGNNENIWGHEEWGWAPRLGGRSWGLGYYLDVLPALLGELDPSRPYTPGSPFSPAQTPGETRKAQPEDAAAERHPNDPAHGSTHLWELWNRQDYPHYRDTVARFVGEFGWQGPPTWATMTRSISDRPLTPESPGMLVHQKAIDGNVKLIDGLVAHLPLPDDMDDWHWAMSLNQATAVQVGIEHFRSLSPVCMGTIVWQLNDCWPVTSWAAVDGDGRPKPLLYSIAHAYADRLLTVQPGAAGLAAIAVNDSGDRWTGDAVIRRLRFDGSELAAASVPVDAPARSTATVSFDTAVGTAADPGSELLEVRLGETRALWFFAEYRDSALAPAELETSVVRTSTGYDVTVTAGNLVRDLALLIDRVDPAARVDDQLVTVLPGESVTFAVTCAGDLDEAALVSPIVLRSANQLVAP